MNASILENELGENFDAILFENEPAEDAVIAPKYLIEAENIFPNEWSFDKNRAFRAICSDIIWDSIYNLQTIELQINEIDYIVKKASHWCALVYTCIENIELDAQVLQNIFSVMVNDIMLFILLQKQLKNYDDKIENVVSKSIQDVLIKVISEKLIKQNIADNFLRNCQQLFLMYNSKMLTKEDAINLPQLQIYNLL